jgi:tetratricopeptide (TPR) repeat protein
MNPPIRAVLGCLMLLIAGICKAQTGTDPQAVFSRHIQQAQKYLAQKRPDLAIPELQAAATINPDNVETQGNLGVLLFFQGNAAEAIPHLRMAVEKQPSLSKIRGILGIAELHTQDFVEGRKDLETAFPAIDDQRFKIQVGLELVGVYTDSGDLEQAAGILAELKKTAPDNPEVLYASYRTFADLSSEAMIALSLAAPDSAQMHQLLAHEEIKEGNSNAVIAQYRKAIAIDPRLPGVHFELAELLHTQDPAVKKEAEQEYRAALQENPQDEKAICALAEIAETKGDTQQAYDDYSKAVALQPGDANAKLGLAKVLIEMDQQDKALPLLEASAQLEPTNATVHYRLATLYRKMGRMDDAKREVELYQKYKDMKEKLRAVYKELLIQPDAIRADENPEEEPSKKK